MPADTSVHCAFCANKPLPPYRLDKLTPAQIVALLPVCPQCNRHGPCPPDGICDRCEAGKEVYHARY